MTLATKNGSLILKDGALAENCGCCGGWYCYTEQCRNTDVTPRTEMWNGCDGDNPSPSSIQVSVAYSGARSEHILGYLYADPQYDATYTLTRGRELAGPFECLYGYQDDFIYLRVIPGIACGSGWDAAIACYGGPSWSFGNGPFKRFQLWDPRYARMFPKEAIGDAAYESWNQAPSAKGVMPYRYTFPIEASRGDRAGWSETPCQMAPNRFLTGMSWKLWCYPYTVSALPAFLACTVSVV